MTDHISFGGHNFVPGLEIMTKLITYLCSVIVVLSLQGCNTQRGPAVSSTDDGQIKAQIQVSRGVYREGETVEVFFTLENITDQDLRIEREDGLAWDLALSTGTERYQWSEGPGSSEDLTSLILAPGEISRIDWSVSDLENGKYSFIGTWWSRNVRESNIHVRFSYGPYRK
jgi:hypothetical protein